MAYFTGVSRCGSGCAVVVAARRVFICCVEGDYKHVMVDGMVVLL